MSIADIYGFVKEYKELITFVIALLTSGLLIFVKGRIDAATKEIKKAAIGAETTIGAAGEKLDSQLIATGKRLSDTTQLLGLSSDRMAGQVATMGQKLGTSATDFGTRIDQAVADLQPKLEKTLAGSVDGISDALMKKLQSVRNEIAQQVEEAVANALHNGIERGSGGVAGDEIEDDDTARWEELRDHWATTKSEIDGFVAEALEELTDGRSQRRYNNLNRHHYDDIAIKLYADDRLSEPAVDAVIDMQAAFNSKKSRRSPVSVEDLEEFRRLRHIWVTND